MRSNSTGTLFVVATPIGNLDDISPRACRVLESVDLIAAEDTRRTRGLLSKFGVKTPTISCHDHNEARQTPRILERLQRGESVALVSDAGTPLLSDPGLLLVRAAHDAGVPVVSVPGPSALAAALSVAGESTGRFIFEGFLPRRPGHRRRRLESLAGEAATVVLFESVHRIRETMAELLAQFGSRRRASIVRELTKLHERVHRGTLRTLTGQLGGEIPLKGEFVLVIAGADGETGPGDREILRVFDLLAVEVSNRAAAALAARILGVSRNRVYRLTRGRPL